MFEIILTTGIHLFWNKPADQPAERYRWTNTVLVDPKGMKDINGRRMVTPYQDPPNGGFEDHIADHSPYYYDDDNCEECSVRNKRNYYKYIKGNRMEFVDYPNDPRLKPGQKIEFRACVVDTFDNDREIECVNWNWIKQRGVFGKTEIVK